MVHKLTVDCLLGMDILAKRGAVIDCVKNSLSLTSGSIYLQLYKTKKPEIVAVVSVSETVQISARSKVFASGNQTSRQKGWAGGTDGA